MCACTMFSFIKRDSNSEWNFFSPRARARPELRRLLEAFGSAPKVARCDGQINYDARQPMYETMTLSDTISLNNFGFYFTPASAPARDSRLVKAAATQSGSVWMAIRQLLQLCDILRWSRMACVLNCLLNRTKCEGFAGQIKGLSHCFFKFSMHSDQINAAGCAPTHAPASTRHTSRTENNFAAQFSPILILKASWVFIISRIVCSILAGDIFAFPTLPRFSLIETSADNLHQHLTLDTLISQRTWDPRCPLND